MYVIFGSGPDQGGGYLTKDGLFGCVNCALVVDDYQDALQMALAQAKEHDRLCRVELLQHVHAELAARQRKVCQQHKRSYRKAAYEYLPFQRIFVRVVDADHGYDPDDDPLAGIQSFASLFLIMKADNIEGYVAEADGVIRSLTGWEAEAVADYFVVDDEF